MSVWTEPYFTVVAPRWGRALGDYVAEVMTMPWQAWAALIGGSAVAAYTIFTTIYGG